MENANNPRALVYKGCAEMELNKIEEAINTFQQLLAQHNDYKDMANWYLALCYLKKGDEAEVKNRLELVTADDKPYYDKAQLLLKEL